MITRFTLCFIALFFMNGCSVYKAASNEGITVSDIAKCRQEGCFLSYGMDIMDKSEDNGKYVVTYRAIARKSGVNYARAAGHGVLDVMTLGLWEVAGTPIEGAMSNNRGFVTAKVTYESKNKEVASSIQIYDPYGRICKEYIVD